jgi:hypothetical protein
MAISGRRRIGIVSIVAALAVAAAGVASVRADPAPDLPPIDGDQLLASSIAALARPFSIAGDVETHVDLGIPQLPSGLGGGTGDGVMRALSLIGGDQRFKVWHSPDGVRVARLLPFSEQDLVVSASDAWFWDSSDTSAVHLGVPGMQLWEPASSAAVIREADLVAFTRRALDALAPYADVAVDSTSIVAGRPAYELTLTPTSIVTLIGRVAVAIDAETRLPLRFRVFPRGSEAAAIDIGFTSVSHDAIDPSMFSFTPPPGTTVRQGADVLTGARAWTDGHDGEPPVSDPRFFGSGFDQRVAMRLDSPLPAGVGPLLPYAGPLMSAITVDRAGATWLLVGPVSAATLRDDAASLP